MSVQRFTAPSSREALAKARHVFGDSAVILSSRSTERGFEVVATAEENLESIAGTALSHSGRGTVRRAAATAAGGTGRSAVERPAPPTAASSVAQDTETLAMSTLSFQDYVRERMLRKRRELLQGEGAGSEAVAAAESTSRATPRQASAATPAMASNAQPPSRTAPSQNGHTPTGQAAGMAAAAATVAAARPLAGQGPEAAASNELHDLRAMIEERFNALAWLGQARQSPIQSNLMLKLIRAGYSPTVARAVLERLPAEQNPAQAFRWMMDVLERNLKTARDASALCDEGGVFALIGPTGVGKTTTAAKLAAQCVKAYGPNSVGLITLDTYRIAGYEQLRTFGRMMGVVAHLAHDQAALQDLLGLLANKRMVIIDSTGLSQKDPRISEMLELLASPRIKKLLVLNAGSHGDTLDDVVAAYRGSDLYGVVLSKTDEAQKLGPAIDTLIRHALVLRGVCTGQRVPEDWQRPDAKALVRQSMASGGKSAFDPQEAELGFFFGQGHMGSLQLDAFHA